MSALVRRLADHPKRRPLAMDALLRLARRFAATATVPPEDEGYRDEVLARLSGAVTELVED